MAEERADFRLTVLAQPELLRDTEKSVAAALAEACPAAWKSGETIAIVGMGASTCAGNVLMPLLNDAGVRAVNLDASVAMGYPAGFQAADHYVIVSESGRSPEPLEVARRAPSGRRIGITNEPGSPLAECVDLLVPLGGFTDSGTYTIGYTASLLALGAVARAALERGGAAAEGGVRADPLQRLDATRASDVIARALDAFAPHAARLAERLDDCTSIDIVGRGVSHGSACGAALLLRESAMMPAQAFETYQYLHGPMESCGPATGVLAFGEGREVAMMASLADAGSRRVLIAAPGGGVTAQPGLDVVVLPEELSGLERALAETACYQLLCVELAARRGVDVGKFRFEQPDTKIARV